MKIPQATPDQSRPKYCHYVDPENQNVCGEPITGRGRYKYCEKHSTPARNELRVKKSSQYNKTWRQREKNLYDMRRWVDRSVSSILDAQNGGECFAELEAMKSDLVQIYRKFFGDTDAVINIEHGELYGYHTYLVYEPIDDEEYSGLGIGMVYSKHALDVPGCFELPPESPDWEMIQHYFPDREYCLDCGAEKELPDFFGSVQLPHPEGGHVGTFHGNYPSIKPSWFAWVKTRES